MDGCGVFPTLRRNLSHHRVEDNLSTKETGHNFLLAVAVACILDIPAMIKLGITRSMSCRVEETAISVQRAEAHSLQVRRDSLKPPCIIVALG